MRVFCFAQSKNNPSPLYSSDILVYLFGTQWVPGYLISYPVRYLGNKLPDNGNPNDVYVI